MSKGGSSGSTKIAPWSGATGAINQALEGAQQVYQTPSPGAYPGQIVAGLNPYQTTAYDWQAQRALAGSPLTGASQDALMGQIQGGYNPAANLYSQYATNPQYGAYQALPAAYQNLGMSYGANPAMAGLMGMGYQGGANPWLNAMYQDAAGQMTDAFNRQVTPNISSMMSRAGRLGSSAHLNQQDFAQENLTQGLSDLAANMYGQQYAGDEARRLAALQAGGGLANQQLGLQQAAVGQLGQLANLGMAGQMGAIAGLGGQYQDDMRRQLAAIAAAPGVAQQDYFDIAQLAGAGAPYQQQQQQELAAEQARWQEAMYGPGSYQNWLNQYIQQISPFSGLGTYQQAQSPSTAQGILGGALGLGTLGNAFAGTETGAALASSMGLPGWGLTLGGAALGGLLGGLV
jgi:hypothetical protein